MKRCVIHGGLGKTGTTTLQQDLAKSKLFLVKNSIFYYSDLIDTNFIIPYILGEQARSSFSNLYTEKTFDFFVEHADKLFSEFESSGCNVLLISAEFMDSLSVFHLEGIRNYFLDKNFLVETVLTVRDPYSRQVSLTQQRIKEGDAFFEDIDGVNNGLTHQIIEKFICVFGFNSVTFYNVDFKNITNQFLKKTFGLSIKLPSINLQNPSISINSAIFFDRYNFTRKAGGYSNDDKFVMSSFIKKIPGTKFFIPKDLVYKFIEPIKKDIQLLREIYHLEFNFNHNEDSNPTYHQIKKILSDDFIDYVLNDMLSKAKMEMQYRNDLLFTNENSILLRVYGLILSGFVSDGMNLLLHSDLYLKTNLEVRAVLLKLESDSDKFNFVYNHFWSQSVLP